MEKVNSNASGVRTSHGKKPVEYYSESMRKWIREWEEGTGVDSGDGTPTERMRRLIEHFASQGSEEMIDEFDELLRDVYVEGVGRGFGKCLDVMSKGKIKSRKVANSGEYAFATELNSVRMQGTIPCFDAQYQMTVKVTLNLDDFGFVSD